jgi:hypothetical protein
MKHLLFIVMASMAAAHFAHGQYTFGPQVQTTNTASITYNSGNGAFQYTDAANSSDDFAYLPLTGTAAAFITISNEWTVSITVNLAAQSLTATAANEAPHAFMRLILANANTNFFTIELDQHNNTGGGDNSDYPDGYYGTAARFAGQMAGAGVATTPLGNSQSSHGSSYLQLSGGTGPPDSPATESISAASGVLTLSYDVSANIVTGYYNGTPIGSSSLAGWGSNPALTLFVNGGSGGVSVAAGTDTASNFYVATQSQYTFGPQVQTTNTASITYNSGTGAFQYTDATNTDSAQAYLPLSGAAAALITTSNGWTASINASLSAAALTVSGGVHDPHTAMALGIFGLDSSNNPIGFQVTLMQMNNTAGGDTSDFPLGFYGSAVRIAGGTYLPTPLGNAFAYSNNLLTGGDCAILPLAAGTNGSAADVTVGATNGILTLKYDPSTTLLTAYFNQEPVAEQSIAGWSQLVLDVDGGDKEVGATNGSITASLFYVSMLPAGNPVIQTTDGNFGVRTNQFGFNISGPSSSVVIEASTNLADPVWTPLATNALHGGMSYFSDSQWTNYPRRFYRLRTQ